MPRMGPGRDYMTVTLPRATLDTFRRVASDREEKMSFVILQAVEKYCGLKLSKTPPKQGRPKNSDKS